MNTDLPPTDHLILLPGMIGTAELFGPLLGVIPASFNPKVISYPTDQVLNTSQLLSLIEHELSGQKRLVLVGESFSGALALAFAAAHPEQVRAVILSAGFVRPPWPSWLRCLIQPALVRTPLPLFLIRFFAAGSQATDESARWVRDAYQMPQPRVMTHRAREALSADFTEALTRCRAPILYLKPDHDHMVRQSSLNWILKNRPDVVVTHLVGPHLILQTAPARSWDAIERFLTSLNP